MSTAATTSLFERNLRHNRLAALYAQWDKSRAGRDIPRQNELNAITLAPWRENLAIIRVRERKNFSYGFYGSGFKDAFGVDMTGLDIAILPPEQLTILRHEYRTVVNTRKPHWRTYSAWFEEDMQTWERLTLPLADQSGTSVSFLLVAAYRLN